MTRGYRSRPSARVCPTVISTRPTPVQELNTKLRMKRGARLTGRKIGLTSKSIQKQLGVDRPDFGILFDTMAIADGEELPFGAVLAAVRGRRDRLGHGQGHEARAADHDRHDQGDRLCLSRDRDLRLAHRQMGLRDAVLAHPTMAEGLGPLLSNVAPRVE